MLEKRNKMKYSQILFKLIKYSFSYHSFGCRFSSSLNAKKQNQSDQLCAEEEGGKRSDVEGKVVITHL